jgi:hypothetical protein
MTARIERIIDALAELAELAELADANSVLAALRHEQEQERAG